MSDPKSTVRYLGYSSLPDGGRRFDFSFALGSAKATMVTIDASIAFFQGSERISIQEATGICYETLKFHIQTHEGNPPERFDLTAADITQHRKSGKDAVGRR